MTIRKYLKLTILVLAFMISFFLYLATKTYLHVKSSDINESSVKNYLVTNQNTLKNNISKQNIVLENIIGKWQFISVSETPNIIDSKSKDNSGPTLEFTSEGRFRTEGEFVVTTEGHYILNGTNLTFCPDNEEAVVTNEISFQDRYLVLREYRLQPNSVSVYMYLNKVDSNETSVEIKDK